MTTEELTRIGVVMLLLNLLVLSWLYGKPLPGETSESEATEATDAMEGPEVEPASEGALSPP